MTAVLAQHVQKFGMIWWTIIELPQDKINIKFEMWVKFVCEMGPDASFLFSP